MCSSDLFSTTDGEMAEVEPATARVVYAADVPGGHRWALVMARADQWWAVNWFAGPSGADPAALTEVVPPSSWSDTEPLALIDVSAATAPILVFGDPATAFEYSPSLDRAPDGSLVRTYQPLPVVDGVPLGEVPAPVHLGAGEVRAVDRPYLGPVWDVRYAGPTPWDDWWVGAETPDLALLAPCLTDLGFTVDVGTGGDSWSYTDTSTALLTSAETAVREKAVADCHVAASE